MCVEVLCWVTMYGLSKNVCFQCASKCSFHRFCLCLLEVISSFRSLRAGSQVIALLILFLSVIVHTMWSGNSLRLLCNLHFLYIVYVCHQNVCEIGSVYYGG